MVRARSQPRRERASRVRRSSAPGGHVAPDGGIAISGSRRLCIGAKSDGRGPGDGHRRALCTRGDAARRLRLSRGRVLPPAARRRDRDGALSPPRARRSILLCRVDRHDRARRFQCHGARGHCRRHDRRRLRHASAFPRQLRRPRCARALWRSAIRRVSARSERCPEADLAGGNGRAVQGAGVHAWHRRHAPRLSRGRTQPSAVRVGERNRTMQVFKADIAIVGAGGAGLRAAIAAAEADPLLTVALISKVYPMRSHTVAAEGGSAGVVQSHDSLQHHFDDTVAGGDWLCEQDVVDYFVAHCTEEMVQLEHWGCPWSRKDDGHVNVRAFGGMKIERTWFAADKTGFHMLHTLFQTSIKYPSIKRFDEYFCCELIVEDGRCQGVLVIEIGTGDFTLIETKAVVIATGGAGRVFRQNTNGGIVTGDGMALAYRQGVPLRDREFVQYHPTALPGTGLLITEACRGEGGILVNRDGYRYLPDYGLGPPDPLPRKEAMELGP